MLTSPRVLSRFNATPASGPGAPGLSNFTGFLSFPPHGKPVSLGTKAGIAIGVISIFAVFFTGLYFLIRCLRRCEQRKQANAILEFLKPQEYPKISPKADRILEQDLETGKTATLQSQKRMEWDAMGVAVAMDDSTGRPPVVPK